MYLSSLPGDCCASPGNHDSSEALPNNSSAATKAAHPTPGPVIPPSTLRLPIRKSHLKTYTTSIPLFQSIYLLVQMPPRMFDFHEDQMRFMHPPLDRPFIPTSVSAVVQAHPERPTPPALQASGGSGASLTIPLEPHSRSCQPPPAAGDGREGSGPVWDTESITEGSVGSNNRLASAAAASPPPPSIQKDNVRRGALCRSRQPSGRSW